MLRRLTRSSWVANMPASGRVSGPLHQLRVGAAVGGADRTSACADSLRITATKLANYCLHALSGADKSQCAAAVNRVDLTSTDSARTDLQVQLYGAHPTTARAAVNRGVSARSG
jgi:hypothetical protein